MQYQGLSVPPPCPKYARVCVCAHVPDPFPVPAELRSVPMVNARLEKEPEPQLGLDAEDLKQPPIFLDGHTDLLGGTESYERGSWTAQLSFPEGRRPGCQSRTHARLGWGQLLLALRHPETLSPCPLHWEA